MDPLTIAARKFMRTHETAWEPPPGVTRPEPKLLRLDGLAEDRADMIKSLRLLEWQPESRRPFVIVEVPFTDESSFLSALVEQVASDVDAVDKGLTADGIQRSEAPTKPNRPDAAAALAFAERCAAHLASYLEGLVLVLAPKSVVEPKAFVSLVRGLVSLRRSASALRIDVLAPTVDALADVVPAAIRFELDRHALFEHLKALGPKSTEGPGEATPPKLSPERRAHIEKELGQPLISLDAGRTLKVLMMDGTRALNDGRAKEAVRKMRAARMLCESTGLVREGILVTAGLGTAYVFAKNLKAAEACYDHARKRAAELELRQLEVQACFGLGQVRMMQHRHVEARPAFERILELETVESPLHAEARRLLQRGVA